MFIIHDIKFTFILRRPIALRGNLEGLNDGGEVVENYKVVKRLIGHQSGTYLFYLFLLIF